MVFVRIQNRLSFRVIGVKTWIPDMDNAAFGEFWQKCHADGAIAGLQRYCKDLQSSQTGSAILGLSCTEKDPSVRSFDFYVAVETDEVQDHGRYEVKVVPAYRWAIFSSEGGGIDALMAARCMPGRNGCLIMGFMSTTWDRSWKCISREIKSSIGFL